MLIGSGEQKATDILGALERQAFWGIGEEINPLFLKFRGIPYCKVSKDPGVWKMPMSSDKLLHLPLPTTEKMIQYLVTLWVPGIKHTTFEYAALTHSGWQF